MVPGEHVIMGGGAARGGALADGADGPRGRRLDSHKQLACASEDLIEHLHRKSAGLGVLPTWVVAGEQREAWEQGLGAMCEARLWRRKGHSLRLHRLQHALEGKLTQRDHDLEPGKRIQMGNKKRPAAGDLYCAGSIAWGGAMSDGGDVQILEPQPVGGVGGGGLAGEAGPVEGRRQELG